MASAHAIQPRLLAMLAVMTLVVSCGGKGGSSAGSSGGGLTPDPNTSALTSTFVSSATGNSTITSGDTIQFEVAVTSVAGMHLNTMFFSLTGDATGHENASTPWAGIKNDVTGWAWNYITGTGNVKFATDGVITPVANTTFPVPVSIGHGWFGVNKTGSGFTSVIGTVTITADTVSSSTSFQGGAFFVSGLDGFQGTAGPGTVAISTGAFTVVP